MTRHAPLPISHAAAPLRRHSHPQAVVTEVPANSKAWRRRNCHSSTPCFRHPKGKHGGLPPDAVSVRGKHASLQPPGRATRVWRRRRRRRAPGCRPAHAPLPVEIIPACSCLPCLPCPALPCLRAGTLIHGSPRLQQQTPGCWSGGCTCRRGRRRWLGRRTGQAGHARAALPAASCRLQAASCKLQAADRFGSIGPIHHPSVLLPQGRHHACIR